MNAASPHVFRKAYRCLRTLPVATERTLRRWEGCCRKVWNLALDRQQQDRAAGEKHASYVTMAKWLTEWRGFAVDAAHGRVKLPKVGWLRYRDSRPVLGIPKTVALCREIDGWHVAIQVEVCLDKAPIPVATAMGAADRGITNFLATDTGRLVLPLEAHKRSLSRLGPVCHATRLQARLARRAPHQGAGGVYQSDLCRLRSRPCGQPQRRRFPVSGLWPHRSRGRKRRKEHSGRGGALRHRPCGRGGCEAVSSADETPTHRGASSCHITHQAARQESPSSMVAWMSSPRTFAANTSRRRENHAT